MKKGREERQKRTDEICTCITAVATAAAAAHEYWLNAVYWCV